MRNHGHCGLSTVAKAVLNEECVLLVHNYGVCIDYPMYDNSLTKRDQHCLLLYTTPPRDQSVKLVGRGKPWPQMDE